MSAETMSTSATGTPSPAPATQSAHEPAASKEASPGSPGSAAPTSDKTVHSLVLDTGALIKNEPPVSTLLAQANELYTIPAVLSEIRDAETRARVDTTLRPFLTIRTPKPESVKFITAFARKTGDLEVLSTPDIHLLALTYDLECERNGGDWRLRNNPSQKQLNGRPPEPKSNEGENAQPESQVPAVEQNEDGAVVSTPTQAGPEQQPDVAQVTDSTSPDCPVEQKLRDLSVEEDVSKGPESHGPAVSKNGDADPVEDNEDGQVDEDEGSDSDGWITPSNLKKHMLKDQGKPSSARRAQRFLQAAIITSDYAMQNVALRINLNLISSGMDRISRLKSYVMRCHGCFSITKDMTKQFCPKCGQPNLIRASCSTDDNGNFTVHLKKNFQWNNRGNVYSVPKPTHGTSSGKLSKVPGGGKNGWGQKLILAEDQKEYVRATAERRRTRQKDLMDEDYLPGIFTGERRSGGERIKVGAGRTVNSKKKRR